MSSSGGSGGMAIRQQDGVPNKISQTIANKQSPGNFDSAVRERGLAAVFREAFITSRAEPAPSRVGGLRDTLRTSLTAMGIAIPERAKGTPDGTPHDGATRTGDADPSTSQAGGDHNALD